MLLTNLSTGLVSLLKSAEGKHTDVATKGLYAVRILARAQDMKKQLGSVGASEGSPSRISFNIMNRMLLL